MNKDQTRIAAPRVPLSTDATLRAFTTHEHELAAFIEAPLTRGRVTSLEVHGASGHALSVSSPEWAGSVRQVG
ncbi:MAG: hypothetical protein IPH72_17345 [Sandaracinaceae bacterium]|nr:hypothetical protein [Sandaracinaceae bacterium]